MISNDISTWAITQTQEDSRSKDTSTKWQDESSPYWLKINGIQRLIHFRNEISFADLAISGAVGSAATGSAVATWTIPQGINAASGVRTGNKIIIKGLLCRGEWDNATAGSDQHSVIAVFRDNDPPLVGGYTGPVASDFYAIAGGTATVNALRREINQHRFDLLYRQDNLKVADSSAEYHTLTNFQLDMEDSVCKFGTSGGNMINAEEGAIYILLMYKKRAATGNTSFDGNLRLFYTNAIGEN